jgi:cobalt-zinc-cadmium efflux system outer membrane protein
MNLSSAVILASLLFLSASSLTPAQEAVSPSQPVKLADLLAEAERSNPQIQSAWHGWDSAKQVPTQVSTLPDPQLRFRLRGSWHFAGSSVPRETPPAR